MPLSASPKSPARVRRGIVAARARWGPPRIARLDDLTPEQRDVVLALINAQRRANGTTAGREEAAAEATATAREVDRASGHIPTPEA